MSNGASNIQTIRIIHIALTFGPTAFIILCSTVLKERLVTENEVFYLVGLVFGIMASVAAFFLPSFLSKSMIKQNDRDSGYQTLKIIQLAILESSALLNGVFFFITGKQESLIISIVLILVLASRFPSEAEKDKLFPKGNIPYN
ncbi:hypothetical protein [Leptospira sp. GIMC2001]|uniref:hypothetical protein n=1 Tax=Leptospira sp. GIMC2001 TaxID=1513297 RepID=UPI00234A9B72|nr:hypothetical protein [Leptospira sp. GIMC2001]WCL49747.1 hypothetical protein O4O04_02695 [Leptospira sp. GIMC2001]